MIIEQLVAEDNTVSRSVTPVVCIVDDDISMANSMQWLVRSFGLRAESFLSAEEFLECSLLEEADQLILILDFRMPGTDGPALQRRLAADAKRIPIIFISARANENEEAEAISGGAVAFLRKPFSDEALFNAIQLALRRRR